MRFAVLASISTMFFLFLPSTALAADSRISWIKYEDARKAQAADPSRPILLFCKYRFCGGCAEMEREALSDPKVVTAIEGRFLPARKTLLGLGDFKFPEFPGPDGKPLTFAATPTLMVISGSSYWKTTGVMDRDAMLRWLDETYKEVEAAADGQPAAD